MSLPEKAEAIRKLKEISQRLNKLSSDIGATGDLKFHIQDPAANGDKWEVYIEGQISDGQDQNGKELWKSSKLQDCYSGETLADAVEQILSDAKKHYCGKLLI